MSQVPIKVRAKAREVVQSLTARFMTLRVDGFLAQIALACALMAVVTLIGWSLRLAAPWATPAALLFPAILVASLIGGWRSGATACALALVARNFPLRPRLAALAAPGMSDLLNFALFVVAAILLVEIGVYARSLVARLRLSRDALAEQTLHYRILFETMSEGFAVCEAIRDESGALVDYTVAEINPALQRMLGVGPESVGSTDLIASRAVCCRRVSSVVFTRSPPPNVLLGP